LGAHYNLNLTSPPVEVRGGDPLSGALY